MKNKDKKKLVYILIIGWCIIWAIATMILLPIIEEEYGIMFENILGPMVGLGFFGWISIFAIPILLILWWNKR